MEKYDVHFNLKVSHSRESQLAEHGPINISVSGKLVLVFHKPPNKASTLLFLGRGIE